jgi:hypothetical protein
MSKNNEDPKFFKTIFNDLVDLIRDIFSGKFLTTIKKELAELHDFFIDRDKKQQLQNMNRFRRWMHIFFWLSKCLILKLSSLRRILFVLALIFILTAPENGDINRNKIFLGIIIFIFILLMELKDKLLARQELEAGRAVQKALLPDESPGVTGWDIWLYTKPANDVGGDLVDFIKISPQRYGITIADVAGKGLGAALFMAKLQSTLRALVFEYSSLVKLAQMMNKIFYRDTLSSSFASMVYLEISSKSGELHLVNAGHPPALIFKEGKIRELPKGAQALGIMPDVKYKEEEFEFNSGEVLLVYSDGLSEAMNKNGTFFGEEKIYDLLAEFNHLPARQAGEKILNAVHKFTGDVAQSDDLSLIIIKRT